LELKDAKEPGSHDASEPSKPGLASRFVLLFWRHREHIVPLQPKSHVVGVGVGHNPLPLHVRGPVAMPFEHAAAPQPVVAGG